MYTIVLFLMIDFMSTSFLSLLNEYNKIFKLKNGQKIIKKEREKTVKW